MGWRGREGRGGAGRGAGDRGMELRPDVFGRGGHDLNESPPPLFSTPFDLLFPHPFRIGRGAAAAVVAASDICIFFYFFFKSATDDDVRAQRNKGGARVPVRCSIHWGCTEIHRQVETEQGFGRAIEIGEHPRRRRSRRARDDDQAASSSSSSESSSRQDF